MTLVEILHASRRFGTFTAVDDVSLTLSGGEILGLIGANGAGKTTLIRMICGLIRPSDGTVSVAGRPGYMCQSFSLVEELTVAENIRYYGALYGMSRRQIAERQEQIAGRLALTPYLDRPVKDLPSGWRQALSFAIAVLANPPLLILDEPTSGLDSLSRRRLWKILHEEAARGTGIIVSTHSFDEAYYCTRIAVMKAGRIVADTAPEALASVQDDLMPFFQ